MKNYSNYSENREYSALFEGKKLKKLREINRLTATLWQLSGGFLFPACVVVVRKYGVVKMKINLNVCSKHYWRDHAAPERIYDN